MQGIFAWDIANECGEYDVIPSPTNLFPLYIPVANTEIATQGLSFPRRSASLHSSLRKDLCPRFLPKAKWLIGDGIMIQKKERPTYASYRSFAFFANLFISADGAMLGIRGAHMGANSAYFSARMSHIEAVIFACAFIFASPCFYSSFIIGICAGAMPSFQNKCHRFFSVVIKKNIGLFRK
ncbi:MAG: hypothetical protein WC609_04055 [Candidatus Paceibacterota bacterium]|jgi:hypothetical protein